MDGAAQVLRFYDTRQARVLARISPGEYYVTDCADEAVVTTLGSCVSACVRDPALQLGGMNHFMLPGDSESAGNMASNIYGVAAMEALLNEILKRGGRRGRLEFKLTGGGRIGSGSASIGKSNAAFALRFLETEGFTACAVDLGGDRPRKVFYEPSTGRLRVRKLEAIGCEEAIRRERAYAESFSKAPISGGVELF